VVRARIDWTRWLKSPTAATAFRRLSSSTPFGSTAVHAQLPRRGGTPCRARARHLLRDGPNLGAKVRTSARRLRRRRPRPSDRWHLDEMVPIAGKRMYLWRVVDDEGEILDMLVQRRRGTRAALRMMRKLLKKQGFMPKSLVTDKLRSYASAFRRLRLTCPHEQGLRRTIGQKIRISGATTRAQDAAVQIGSIGPAVPQHTCRRPQYLQSPAPSCLAIDASDLQSRSRQQLANRSRGGTVNLACPSGLRWLTGADNRVE
jgi:DDE domain